MLRLILALQAAAMGGSDAIPPSTNADILARAMRRPPPCPESTEGEIVVCAGRDETPRLRIEPLPAAEPDDGLHFRLPGGATVSPEAVAGQRFGEPQITVTVRVPF